MKIIGNAVGAPVPRTNYNQTDPTRADYLIGRDLLEQRLNAAMQAAQTAGAAGLPKTGGTMEGPIVMDGNRITALAEPGAGTDAATKQYADACRDNARDYADECRASAEAYTDAVAEEIRQEAHARIRAAAPVNLLDNSNFKNPVNQRGEDEYYGTSAYTIDRWRAVSSLRVTVASDCVTIKHEGNVNSAFIQYLGSGVKLAQGETYTVAIKLKGSPAVCGSVVRSAADYDVAITLSSGTTVRLAGSKDRLLMMVVPGDLLQIEWIALYEGAYTEETLPDYRPKDYTTELHTCERYFRVLRNASGYVSASNAYIFSPFKMRTTPTAIVKSIGSIRTQGKSVTPTSVSEVTQYAGGSMRVTMPGEYGSANHAATLYDAKIWLSADLGEG